jgi:YVTN family beta-propeller protein
LALLLLLLLFSLAPTCRPPDPGVDEAPSGRDLFASPQADPIVLGPEGRLLYVANTTSHTVSVIDTASKLEIRQIRVGVEPVSVAVRPDGAELWVSNHVSDSVSVIDLRPGSSTRFEVVATIQDVDEAGVTRFDEPAGIAFASSGKAYVALSSRNRIAIVDIDGDDRSVRSASIVITAQDPRAIRVRDGRLYVIPFESMNQTELSSCPEADETTAPQCTLDLFVPFAGRPNLPDEVKNIVVDPDVPDRDLFVFDTRDESPVGSPVTGVGTLLYGVAVDSQGRVFVTQTEALNAVNGDEGQNLIDLDNRMFLNQITRISCGGGSCGSPVHLDLEPTPPARPDRSEALATPYGIAISDDDSTLVATAAGTSRLFTMDTDTGEVTGIVDVGAIPRGVALRSDPHTGAPKTAYVLNTLDNSVTVVDIRPANRGMRALELKVRHTTPVGDDPTPEAVRLGRIVFNDALASTSGTFSCGSCHPDGHTDQLLWRIGGACFFDDADPFLGGNCSGNAEPRLTQPVRGLRNTLPLHWDGSLGDPIGGVNGSVGSADLPPDCTTEHECFRHLVDASLSGVMCDQDPECAVGPSGLPGLLGDERREQLAAFLGGVSYPPARSRRMDDSTSEQALDGFRDFFMEQGGNTAEATCAESFLGCHDLPLGTTTNSFLLGFFDSVTLRGLTDRFIQFSNGIASSEENLSLLATDGVTGEMLWDPEQGYDEFVTFAGAFGIIFGENYGVGPNDIFQMFEEATTGTSGATGRQLTLSKTSAGRPKTLQMIEWLEAADTRDAVDLRGIGRWNGEAVTLHYEAESSVYAVTTRDGSTPLERSALFAEAAAGTLLVTLTGELPRHFGAQTHRQPLIAPFPLESLFGVGPTGDPLLPHFPDPDATEVLPLELEGIDIREDIVLLLNGQRIDGTVECVDGVFEPYCRSQEIRISLAEIPPKGTHLLQVQNPGGPQSNEVPVCVGPAHANQGQIVRCLP